MLSIFFKSKFPVLVLLFSFQLMYAQKLQNSENTHLDSLRKYSIPDLLRKSYSEINPKIYCDEMFKRKLSDRDKMKYYRICGEKYYLEILNDFYKCIEYMKISNTYALKLNDITMYSNNLNMIALVYALQNKNDLALLYLKKRKKYDYRDKTNIQELIFAGDEGLTYGVLGDFNRKTKGYKRAINDLDNYLLTIKNIDSGLLYEIDRAKAIKYNNIVDAYLLQKKLDSAALYMAKLKKLPLPPSELDNASIRDNEVQYSILRGDLDDAIKRSNKDLNEFRDDRATIFYDSYYLAVAYQLKKDYKKSQFYCEQALTSKMISFGFINFELELYKLAMRNAENLGNKEAYIKYAHQYQEINQKFDYNSKSDFMAKLYDLDEIQPLQYELNRSESKSQYLWGTVLFLFLLASYFLWRFIRSRKDKKKFLEIIERFKQKEISDQHLKVENTESEAIDEENKNALAPEKEKEILKKLSRFESREQFLSPDLSISTLAASMNVNYSYLSVTIKKYKMTNFNGYINQLRIDYIIQKMRKHPEYLTYKISYLAEECGFASHTTFTRIFIEKTGISPSKFITYLQKENSELPIFEGAH